MIKKNQFCLFCCIVGILLPAHKSLAWDPWTLSPVINFYTQRPAVKTSTSGPRKTNSRQNSNSYGVHSLFSRVHLRALKSLNVDNEGVVQAFDPQTASTHIYGDLDPEVEEQVLIGLMKPQTNIVLISGDSGVGKKAMANLVANRLIHNKVPVALQNYRVLVTDSTRLIGGATNRGDFEERVQKLLALSRKEKTILLVQDFANLRGKGSHSADAADFFNMIESELGGKNLKILAMAPKDTLVNSFAGAEGILDYIDEVYLEEPQGEKLIERLDSWVRHQYARKNFNKEIIEYAIELSEQFDAVGSQPKKSQLLLQDAMSKLIFKDRNPSEISKEDINAAAIKRYRINSNFFDPDQKLKQYKKLQEEFFTRVIGQDEALEALLNEFRRIVANVHDTSHVRFGALLVGDSGLGKTETISTFADILQLPYKRIMMSKYATPEAKDIEFLKQDIHKALAVNAQTILFFDEIEKAPLFIQNGLLDLFDEGRFTVQYETDQTGRHQKSLTVNVRNATVFLATNAGQDYLKHHKSETQMGFVQTQTNNDINIKVLKEALTADNLAKALIDRLPIIVPYKYMSQDEFLSITLMHLNNAIKIFEESKGLKLRFSAAAKKNFVSTKAPAYFTELGSNRALFSFLNEELRDPLSEVRIAEGLDESSFTIKFDKRSNKLIVKATKDTGCQKALN